MESRRIELVCGVLAGAFGLTALGALLFAPLESDCLSLRVANPSGPYTCGSVSLVQAQGVEILWLPIMLWGGLWLGVVLCAVWHSLARSRPALVLLWVYTALLCLATIPVLPIAPIGFVFVPADVLALGASIAGALAARQPAPAPG